MTATEVVDSTSTPATGPRMRVDMKQLTLEDLGAIDKECWDRLDGVTLDVALRDYRQKPAMAIVVWYVESRRNPAFTLEDANRLRPLIDFELVESDPEASSNGTTTAPPPLLESGA